jgi:hypothetical protein
MCLAEVYVWYDLVTGAPDDPKWKVDEAQKNPWKHKEAKTYTGPKFTSTILEQLCQFHKYVTDIM